MELFTKTIEMDNFSMDYFCAGNGQPVIIIPGLCDGFKTVKEQGLNIAWYFRKYILKYKVYVFSRRNQITRGFSTQDMAKDQAEVMKYLGITNARVIGISMGGMIVQHLALMYPELVEKLAIVVSSAKQNEVSKEVLSYWIRLMNEGRLDELTIEIIEKHYNQKLRSSFKKLNYLNLQKQSHDSQRFIDQAQAFLKHDVFEELKKIRCSTLVVGGLNDKVVTGWESREIAEIIPKSKLILYSHSGHGLIDEVKEYEKDIISFLK